MHAEGLSDRRARRPVIPAGILALGAGGLVCALSASMLGRPREAPRRLSAAEREVLLDMVPRGEAVRIEAVDEAAALGFARAALALLTVEGRVVEERAVFTIRGVAGSGVLHVAREGGHSLLVLGEPEGGCDALPNALPTGQPPPKRGKTSP